MGFLDMFFGRKGTGSPTGGSVVNVGPGSMPDIFGGEYTDAIAISSVARAVQILSNAVVGLPVHVRDEKYAKIDDHPITRLLSNDGEANPIMSAVNAKAALMFNIALWGNGYAYIERDSQYQPVGLYPLPSATTKAIRRNGQLFYSTFTDKYYTLGAQDVLHIGGPLTLDGISSLAPLTYAKSVFGLSAALESFASKFFSQGGNIGGIIETPPMKEDARANFLRTWRETYTGPDAAWKIAALPGGMKFVRTTADPEQAQSVESRVHQIREVARVFGIPPHMLGDLEKSSYASVEAQLVDFYCGTIQPYVIRWEAEISRKLLAENEKRRLRVRMNMNAKMRGTTMERYSAYQVAWGRWKTTNEIREDEDMPPVEGGDILLQPLNMAPASGNAAGSPKGE